MNYLVDIMIVGDSTTGHEILDKIASSKPAIKLAFISHAFKSTTTHDYVNVKYFRQEVEYVSYRNRLFCCYLKNGDNIFSTHLVIATGLKYEPFMLNGEPVPCVLNALDDVPKIAKDRPALVICSQDADAKLALEAAKKYKQVYMCSKELDISKSISAATSKKLSKTENIAMLPNATIKKVVLDKNGTLQKVELDNYSEINCTAIYTKTTSKPAIEFIPKKILTKEDGYPVTTENCESTLIPKCFVVGSCLKKYTKAMEQSVITAILNDF